MSSNEICPSDGSFVPGPSEPIANLGCSAVENRSAARRAIRADAALISRARPPIPYSSSVAVVPPNVFVSTAPAPASKYPACSASTASGRDRLSISLQPSSPAKSASDRSIACKPVPVAPSSTSTCRSAQSSSREGPEPDISRPIVPIRPPNVFRQLGADPARSRDMIPIPMSTPAAGLPVAMIGPAS